MKDLWRCVTNDMVIWVTKERCKKITGARDGNYDAKQIDWGFATDISKASNSEAFEMKCKNLKDEIFEVWIFDGIRIRGFQKSTRRLQR